MVALTVVAAQVVQAAPMKKAAAKKATKAPVQKAVVIPADEASIDGVEKAANAGVIPAAVSGETLMETNVPPSAQNPATSTAGLAKAINEAKPRRIFAEFYTETFLDMANVKEGTGTPTLSSFGGMKYDFGNARSLSVRQNFTYKSAGSAGIDTRGGGEFHVEDIALNYTDGKLATILGDGAVIFIGRVYLPTGETSRFLTHNNGQARAYFIETKTLGKWELTLVQLARYFNWTQDSYFKDGKEAQNTEGSLSAEFDAFYNFNSVLSAGFIAGYDKVLKRPLANNDILDEDFYIQPTLQVVPTKGVTAQVYLYNEMNTRNPSHAFALLREEETQVWANLALTL